MTALFLETPGDADAGQAERSILWERASNRSKQADRDAAAISNQEASTAQHNTARKAAPMMSDATDGAFFSYSMTLQHGVKSGLGRLVVELGQKQHVMPTKTPTVISPLSRTPR